MTLGSAAASVGGGAEGAGRGRSPPGTRAPLEAQDQVEVGEGVADLARGRASRRRTGGARRGGASAQAPPGRPSMPPSRPRGGRVSTRTAPSARSASQAMPWRTGFAGFADAARQLGGDAGARRPAQAGHPGADAAGGRARGADRRAEVHHRLRVVARAAPRASVAAASARRRGFAAGSGVLDGEEPRHHPLDVAVDHHRRPVEGDGGDGGGGVGADAGQRRAAPPRCRGSARRARRATTRAQASRLRARA